MKKIILTAAIVCAAVVSQAATFEWRVGTSAINDGSGVTSATKLTTVYLYNATDYSQATLLAALTDATAPQTFDQVRTKAIDYGTLASGKMDSYKSIDEDDVGTFGENIKTYFVVFDDTNNKLYINSTKEQAVMSPPDTTSISGASFATSSKKSYEAGSTWKDKGAGWYAVGSAVPEPTSGLLLLLGMAGLALRRRRA